MSSVEDRAEAAQQLQSAYRDLDQWEEDFRNDPNSPRDVFEGVDYGILLTYGMYSDQARLISNQYDYIDWGQPEFDNPNTSVLETQIGGDTFFIRGTGIDRTYSISPSVEDGLTELSKTQLGDYSGFSEYTDPGSISTDSTLPQLPSRPSDLISPSIQNDIPSSGVEELASGIVPRPEYLNSVSTLPGQTTNNDTSLGIPGGTISNVGNRNPTQGGTLAQPAGRTGIPGISNESYTPPVVGNSDDIGDLEYGTAAPVTGGLSNNDDQGGVTGTGIDSGYVDTSTIDGVLDASGDNVEREDVGEGDPAGTPGSSDQADVNVSQFAKPGDNGNSLYEENIADLPILPNVLHKYTNWTYNVSWYMLDPESHESIVRNGGITNPGRELRNLMMRSGSTGRAGVLGQNGDYYIENLRFTTIFGQNSQTTKSSNNFDIRFEVVEPYGVAFLSELIQLAQANGIADHFDIPYLLEIKFKGYDDYGNIINDIPGSGPKYIPLKIINITFKIVSGATVYSVQAVPYAHSPLQNQWNAFIHESISIKGSTFEELMSSLFEYLNNSEKTKAEEQSRTPDEYKFIIHDNDLKSSKVGFVHNTQGQAAQIDRLSMSGGEDTKEFVQITGGSTLKSAVQAIAAATDFGARFNTVGQPESNADNNKKPFRLLKIVPVVTKLNEYNTSTKQYSKTVVYKIETQKMYGFVLPDMPGAKPTQRGWQKEYNWIFTGKNQDIVDFEADYNIQYFNIRNSYVSSKGKVTGTPSANSSQLPDDGITRTDAGGKVYSPAIVTASSPLSDSVQNSFRGAAHQLAADHMDNVLNNPGADMISINLKIIGDPDWIAQDKSILPTIDASSGNARIVNGSVAIDNHDVFFMLRFKTPRDYDPEKGLMKIDTEQTFVQGLYRVISIDSNFYDGKFEQNLKAIRVQDQVSNDPANIPNLTRGYRGIGWKSDSRDNSTNSTTAPKPSPNVQVWDRLAEQRAEASAEITAFGYRNAPSAPFRTQEPSQETQDFFEGIVNTNDDNEN